MNNFSKVALSSKREQKSTRSFSVCVSCPNVNDENEIQTLTLRTAGTNHTTSGFPNFGKHNWRFSRVYFQKILFGNFSVFRRKRMRVDEVYISQGE